MLAGQRGYSCCPRTRAAELLRALTVIARRLLLRLALRRHDGTARHANGAVAGGKRRYAVPPCALPASHAVVVAAHRAAHSLRLCCLVLPQVGAVRSYVAAAHRGHSPASITLCHLDARVRRTSLRTTSSVTPARLRRCDWTRQPSWRRTMESSSCRNHTLRRLTSCAWTMASHQRARALTLPPADGACPRRRLLLLLLLPLYAPVSTKMSLALCRHRRCTVPRHSAPPCHTAQLLPHLRGL